jgi:hypothetical protein
MRKLFASGTAIGLERKIDNQRRRLARAEHSRAARRIQRQLSQQA